MLPFIRRFSDPALEVKIGKGKLEDAIFFSFDYLEAGVRGELSDTETYVLLVQMFKCLDRYLKLIEIPVTLNTFISHLNLLGHAVDQSFPYYAQSGLLRFVINPKAGFREEKSRDDHEVVTI